ncbi:MAG: thiamine-phosphate kinase [Pirellulaceae bacterium]
MENDLLRWFQRALPAHERLVLGAGDDAAVIKIAVGMQLVATTDTLMDGVDFVVGQHDPAQIGHKALAVNLSDLAAMAAKPVAALVSLCLPKNGGESLAKRLYEGILPLASTFDCSIAGGDVNSWDGPLVVTVTALGEVRPGREWRRSGALPGDLILVTGSFGGSILGKHLTFKPRVAEALWLAEQLPVHAAIDVSDGLSLDLWRLAESSGIGACLDLPQVPIADAALALAKQQGQKSSLKHAPLEHALGDGEDFELILAVGQEAATEFFRRHPDWKARLSPIGHFCDKPGLWSIEPNGLRPLKPRGWEHPLDA